MKRRIGLLFASLLVMAATAAAQGTVCTFDDLPILPAGQAGALPANYCGLTILDSYDNPNAASYFSGTWYGAPAYSQPNALFVGLGLGAIQLEFTQPNSVPTSVTFNGFWAITTPSSCWSSTSCGAATVTYYQYLTDNTTYTVTATVQPGVATWIGSGYTGSATTYRVYIVFAGVNGDTDPNAPLYMSVDNVTYNAPCGAPTISPTTQQNFPTTGGTGTIAVSDAAACPWTAASSVPWITITAGGGGTGNGTVSYSVDANTSSGFRDGTISVSGASVTIQEAGVAQFQVQGTTAPNLVLGTSNVIGSLPVTFNGSGWPVDGGPITISGVNISPNTFSPPSFSGTFQFPSIVSSSTSPPCTLQVTATQGSITKTVTLTGIYIGQVALPDSQDSLGLNAGDQVCATIKYQIVADFFESKLPLVKFGPFAVESVTTDLGGSLFYVSNPESSVQFGDSGILVNSGATLSFPDASGNTIALQGHATAPIQSQVLQPLEGQGVSPAPGPYITSPVVGVTQVSGSLNQSGGVQLDNGALYVNGDATIAGGLAGLGFLIAGGNIQVGGSANLTTFGGNGSTVTVTETFSETDLAFFHSLPFTSGQTLLQVTVSAETFTTIELAAGGNITFTGAAPPSLTNVPGALKQVSVGADGSVWGVNSQQQIYSYNSDPGWINIPGALVQIAVGSSTAVWGLNAQQQIYRWDPVHSVWINVPGSLTQIAVGADGDVWGLNSQSSIYHYNAQTGLFNYVPGTLSEIVVGSTSAVYGLNSAGSIYWYNPVLGSFQWIANSTAFTQIAVGADGDVWAVENNTAYEYDVLHNSMDARPGAAIAQVAVGSGASVLGVSPNGQVFQWNAGSGTWVQVPGSLSSIAVGANGAAWGVNASQQIFTTGQVTRAYQGLSWTPGSLTQISVGADGSAWGLNGQTVEYFNTGTQSFEAVSGAPALAQISVGAGADVWGVDASGNIYQYSTSGNWNNIPGQLNSVSVGANGSVWGINASGQTYTYNSSSQSWTNIPGALAQLSVGGDGTVWGINAQQQIYRFNAATQSWVNVPGALAQISVGNANSIWGVNAQQQVYYYNNATQSWVNVPGAYLAQISVAPDGTVWGVNAVGNLYEWTPSTQTFNFMGIGMSSVTAGNAGAVWALNGSGGIYSWF